MHARGEDHEVRECAAAGSKMPQLSTCLRSFRYSIGSGSRPGHLTNGRRSPEHLQPRQRLLQLHPASSLGHVEALATPIVASKPQDHRPLRPEQGICGTREEERSRAGDDGRHQEPLGSCVCGRSMSPILSRTVGRERGNQSRLARSVSPFRPLAGTMPA